MGRDVRGEMCCQLWSPCPLLRHRGAAQINDGLKKLGGTLSRSSRPSWHGARCQGRDVLPTLEPLSPSTPQRSCTDKRWTEKIRGHSKSLISRPLMAWGEMSEYAANFCSMHKSKNIRPCGNRARNSRNFRTNIGFGGLASCKKCMTQIRYH